VHYPGTYVHGVYNRETTILGGLPVLNEDLVNLPNWLVLKLRIEGADAVRLADAELLDYRHELDVDLRSRPADADDISRKRQTAITGYARIRGNPQEAR
jgi:Glycosyl hydrolase family 65, N-terminal domain